MIEFVSYHSQQIPFRRKSEKEERKKREREREKKNRIEENSYFRYLPRFSTRPGNNLSLQFSPTTMNPFYLNLFKRKRKGEREKKRKKKRKKERRKREKNRYTAL